MCSVNDVTSEWRKPRGNSAGALPAGGGGGKGSLPTFGGILCATLWYIIAPSRAHRSASESGAQEDCGFATVNCVMLRRPTVGRCTLTNPLGYSTSCLTYER